MVEVYIVSQFGFKGLCFLKSRVKRNINIIIFSRVKKVLRLLVATADGFLYVYNLDTNEGGDCTLIKQHR